MTEDVVGNAEQANSKKVSWEAFVKQDVLNFMMTHNLQAITVDDGAGKKGVIKRTSKGDFSVQITSNEILLFLSTENDATMLIENSPTLAQKN